MPCIILTVYCILAVGVYSNILAVGVRALRTVNATQRSGTHSLGDCSHMSLFLHNFWGSASAAEAHLSHVECLIEDERTRSRDESAPAAQPRTPDGILICVVDNHLSCCLKTLPYWKELP